MSCWEWLFIIAPFPDQNLLRKGDKHIWFIVKEAELEKCSLHLEQNRASTSPVELNSPIPCPVTEGAGPQQVSPQGREACVTQDKLLWGRGHPGAGSHPVPGPSHQSHNCWHGAASAGLGKEGASFLQNSQKGGTSYLLLWEKEGWWEGEKMIFLTNVSIPFWLGFTWDSLCASFVLGPGMQG